jgi:LmbE family N-acetylglucosaminyl deacetylase
MHALPDWSSVLAVVAHPDDESFGLGAVLDCFVTDGAEVRVLCLTHGEASTVHGVGGDLRDLRALELTSAARELGVSRAELKDHRDGDLARDHAAVVSEVVEAATAAGVGGLLVFDSTGVTGHPDHVAATAAALEAAERLDLPVLAWTLPATVADQVGRELGVGLLGRPERDIDLTVVVSRERQRRASLAHASQAVPTSILWRRLELLGDVEHLRWLRRPATGVQDARPR